jgi:hypothetical protein
VQEVPSSNLGGPTKVLTPPIWGYTFFPVSGDNTDEPRLLKRPRRPVSMRATFCVAGFAVFLASAFAETKAPASSLAIFFRFESTYSDIALQEMKRELGPIMEQSGYRLEWRNRDEAITPDSFDDLVVVDFRGTCLMEAAGLPHDRGGPLGWTHVADGTVLPFSAVECDRVRSALHSASDVVLGRALARVLAHELYHVLAQTVTHQKTGITRPSLSRADLVSE